MQASKRSRHRQEDLGGGTLELVPHMIIDLAIGACCMQPLILPLIEPNYLHCRYNQGELHLLLISPLLITGEQAEVEAIFSISALIDGWSLFRGA